MEDIHSERYVKRLFSEMSETYGIVNLFSSLGFAHFWRKEAVRSLPADCRLVCDLMAGGAECLSHIKKRCGSNSGVHLVDWCDRMCERARHTVSRRAYRNCSVINASALALPAGAGVYDAIVSTFGLKTLDEHEFEALAKESKRVLKPGGHVSMLEFSLPSNRCFRFFFRLYVKFYVPFLGRILLGNPDNYRMLWRYTREFGDCRKVIDAFEKQGFKVEFRRRFFGSATQIVGHSREGS